MNETRALSASVPHSAVFRQCEDEPITTPGAVQPHGALVVCDIERDLITHASANLAAVLGVEAAQALRMQPQEFARACRLEWPVAGLGGAHNGIMRLAHMPDGQEVTVCYFAYGPRVFLEFEPAAPVAPDVTLLVANAMQRLRHGTTLLEVYQEAVDVVHALTGFDRVVMYVFDAAWHGEVVAEHVRPGCARTLGLRFPSTDIPAQARELYAKTACRAVVDVDYVPVPMMSLHLADEVLDLSACSLRSLSPVHRKYVRNFGGRASLSLSVMFGDQLHGLISCVHEQGPLWVPPHRRHACMAIAEAVSGMLERDYAASPDTSAGILARGIIRKMSRLVDVSKVLMGDSPNMMELARAGGAALHLDEQLETCGQTPAKADILRLVAWLRGGRLRDGVFVSDTLPSLFEDAQAYRDCACGVLAIVPSEDPFTLLLWFRGEIERHIAWGGEVKAAGTPEALQPRHSFQRWQQAVQLHAEPFSNQEIANAKQLADDMRQSIVRDAMHLAKANAALERSNYALDAFAHAASHDLKEPLRGVHNFATMAQRELREGRNLDTVAARLDTVLKLADRMNTLIAALMHYARVGANRMDLRPTQLTPLIDALLDTLRKPQGDRPVEFDMQRPLPSVMADPALLTEVFTNLFTNAIKYNTRPHVHIQVGMLGDDAEEMVTIFVRDNGIGVAKEHHDEVFEIFRRLHAREKFGGGSGTGLTIAKRIIESHGGTMWLDSLPHQGSTFYFTMHRAADPAQKPGTTQGEHDVAEYDMHAVGGGRFT